MGNNINIYHSCPDFTNVLNYLDEVEVEYEVCEIEWEYEIFFRPYLNDYMVLIKLI